MRSIRAEEGNRIWDGKSESEAVRGGEEEGRGRGGIGKKSYGVSLKMATFQMAGVNWDQRGWKIGHINLGPSIFLATSSYPLPPPLFLSLPPEKGSTHSGLSHVLNQDNGKVRRDEQWDI